MSLAELPQVMALPPQEKLLLLEELWEAVLSEMDSLEVSPQEKEVLDARWTDYLSNPESALTVDQFQSRMRARPS